MKRLYILLAVLAAVSAVAYFLVDYGALRTAFDVQESALDQVEQGEQARERIHRADTARIDRAAAAARTRDEQTTRIRDKIREVDHERDQNRGPGCDLDPAAVRLLRQAGAGDRI